MKIKLQYKNVEIKVLKKDVNFLNNRKSRANVDVKNLEVNATEENGVELYYFNHGFISAN